LKLLKKRRNANGVKYISRIVDGENHRGKPSNKRYAIIPARALSDPNVAPYDLLVLGTLGLFVSRSGVSFPTIETIRAYTGLSRSSILNALKRLTIHGLIRKLQQKRFPSQTSKWLTNRYQVMFRPDDPLPTDEDLIASIPYATDTFETYAQSETKLLASQVKEETEQTEKAKGIERGVKAISQTYGYVIQTDNQSLTTLANQGVNQSAIAQAFRLHLNRFGSLPPSLAVLIQRGCFA
jgi:DNA-binding transcriptional ArsR family regulator